MAADEDICERDIEEIRFATYLSRRHYHPAEVLTSRRPEGGGMLKC